jgi:hypothetical protein
MKADNTSLKRQKFEMPNVENIIYKANGMQIFN